MVSGCIGIILLTTASIMYMQAQVPSEECWNGKQCAVALTYDDALNVHLDSVAPFLDSLGLKATFYVVPLFEGFQRRIDDWERLARKGHELGNHTLFHPCDGEVDGRTWVKPEYNLRAYTHQRFKDELIVANAFLSSLDGRTDRTFAYPCGDMAIGDSSYVDMIRPLFVGARGVAPQMQRVQDIDPYNIGSLVVAERSGDELIRFVEEAREKKALVVFLFHGVGGEHTINVSKEAHQRLLTYLKEHESEIWIAPLRDIAYYIKLKQQIH